MFSLHKYFSIANQLFSSSLFKELLNKNEVINMNLKGWPFKPLGDDINPTGGEGPGPGNPY